MTFGRYQPWKDNYVFSCAGCGKEFEAPDCISSPLDGLDCCSIECDRIVEARPRPICKACDCAIDEDGTCGCNPWDA
jgi:hypothetical protein